MSYSDYAKIVLEKEISSIKKITNTIGHEFDDFVLDLDRCNGTLIWSGIGKSGIICKKIVATLQSLGIKALFLHPSEALHGDLGIIRSNDLIILVSNSGETKELIDLIIPIRNLDAKIFSIVGRKNSTIEKNVDKTLIIEITEEAYLQIVPTTSTTTMLALGDAIAASIAQKRGFTVDDFGRYHPKGQLGKRLTLRIKDIMIKESDNSVVLEGSNVEQAIFEMCKKSVSAVTIVDKQGKIKGIFTDGDLRRFANSDKFNAKTTIIDDVMIKKPITLNEDQLIYDAITNTISKHNVSIFPVIDKKGLLVGSLRVIDVLRTGLI